MRQTLVLCSYAILGLVIVCLCLAGGRHLQRRLVSGKWVDGLVYGPAFRLSAQAAARVRASAAAAAAGPPSTGSGRIPCGAAGGGRPCKAPAHAAKTDLRDRRRPLHGKLPRDRQKQALPASTRPTSPPKPTPPPKPDEPWKAVFAAYRRSRRQVCRNSEAVEVFHAANESGCSTERPGHFQVLRDARVTFNSSVSRMAFSVDCKPLQPPDSIFARRPRDILEDEVPGYARGYFSILEDGGADARNRTCDVTVEEPTILHVNPRSEVWNAIFHTLEELFAVLMAMEVLGRHAEDFRMIFLWGAARTRGPLNNVAYADSEVRSAGGSIRLLQLQDQLEPPPPHTSFPVWPGIDPRLPSLKNGPLAPLLELWNRVFASNARLPRLPSVMPRTSHLCFKHVVLPPRACLGSLLTRTWRFGPHRYEPAAARFAGHIVRKFGFALPNASSAPRSRHLQIMVQVRDLRTAHNGRWFDPHDLQRLTRALTVQLDSEVRTDDFGSLSMQQQLTLALETDLLVGIHGSALVHLMFLRPGSGVIELTRQPMPAGSAGARTAENTFVSLAKWMGMQYAFVQYEKAPPRPVRQRSIRFSCTMVVAAAEKMARKIRGGRAL